MFSLLLLLVLPAASLADCPRKCECLWRDAKITVDCSDKEMASIPTDVDPSTQSLNISGNAIPLFSRGQFARFGLVNLQRLSAASCGLGQIDSKALEGLSNLIELDLANNLLTEASHLSISCVKESQFAL